MAFLDTGKAIKRVSELLEFHIEDLAKYRYNVELDVTIGRPEKQSIANDQDGRLNLFLYEALFDPSLKNFPLVEGKPEPLWLVLRYVLTAFDSSGESDTKDAHEFLGEGISVLQELSLLPLRNSYTDALIDNPEVLKITFDETPSDLISKLMQGPDDKYRFSIGFQVRPVMIVTGELPSFPPLVGIDYTLPPGTERTEEEKGVHILVESSITPYIVQVTPQRFQINDTVTVSGRDLNQAGLLTVRLGPVDLSITAQWPEKVEFLVDEDQLDGQVISAGRHVLSVVKILSGGRPRLSNYLFGDLLPVLNNAILTLNPLPDYYGILTLSGLLLGSDRDDIIVSLMRQGELVENLDNIATYTEDQEELTVNIKDLNTIQTGDSIIIHVNRQQARTRPVVEINT
jgi:hypothetical protein